ncbi:DUF4856 domain-containing protein [Shewanella sp. 1CM18E]|uniref:DUF4856 domain-containing protein n=1 Tax=Shewanella sp. 1CM18E TaxID=2929169 RepID=UPI0020BF917D|nr:DUF4856 domain-containing protein [Shewanella sp. 1CM18E]MCK8044819.1 DUF4856 domain-containing protein [Shewanella sp. 1CM18E]
MQLKKSILATTIALSMGLLTACGGSDSDGSPTPEPAPANSTPTDVVLSDVTVDENTANAVVGTLSAVDADSGDTHTFTVAGDQFVIEGNTLQLADGLVLDADGAESLELEAELTVTDNNNASFTKTVTITINDVMDRYTFDSKLIDGDSSVAYTGQTGRHVLIAELNNYIKNQLEADVDAGNLADKAAVLAKLNYFYRPDKDTEYDDIAITFIDNSKDGLLSDITGYKSILEKVAGNDTGGQHKDWNNGAFAGWGATGSTTPTDLVAALFDRLADNAVDKINGSVRKDVLGKDIAKVYVDENGVDLAQLIQKFLLMSVAYSQSSDDYFGVDTDGKGLRTDNTGPAKGDASKPYTNLEHQFDEGFGYFGAAVNYLEYSDVEIAGKVADGNGRSDWNGSHDTDADGKIDLRSEYNFGQSVNAAKRDLGTADNAAATDYTKQAMEAFIAGRKLINDNVPQALTDAQLEELKGFAMTGLDAWERAIVATVVHYINDVTADLAPLADGGDSADFNYENLAKHYSEMKGFALGLQFSEYAGITDADFVKLHELMGEEPVLTGDVDAYIAELSEARDILEASYELDADNVANW